MIGNLVKRIRRSVVARLQQRVHALLMRPAFFSRLVPLFGRIAREGRGSDACLRDGFLPVPVHFYSPIPDIGDLEARHVWDARSPMTGIDFREGAQESLIGVLGGTFGAECNWPFEPTGNPADFHLDNPSFSYGCAASTHCLIRHFKPGLVMEIGSGHSSRVIASAIERNRLADGRTGRHVVVDPYPGEALAGSAFPSTEVIAKRVELLDLSFFDALKSGDILFIDSSHSVKIGSDVNYLFLDVLPRLAPGVVVHVHDIALPYEYPKAYAVCETFRQFWTEQYLLQSFLCFNREFEILLAMNWLMTDRMDGFRAAFPGYDPALHPFFSGSFWLRRVSGEGS